MRGRWGVVAAALLAAPRAGAQTASVPARVRVEPLACATPPFALDAWRALLRTELETDGVGEVLFTAERAESAAVIRLEFPACAEGATELAVVIDDALTRKSVRRAVDLGDVPPAGRPRALALAVAELLRASWAELALPTAAPPPAPPPEPVRRAVVVRLVAAVRHELAVEAPPPSRARPRATRRWSLGASFVAQSFPAANAALLGGRAALSVSPVRAWPVRVRLDANALSGTAFDPLGEIDMGLVSGALSVTIHGGSDRFSLELGPRAELGWSWVQGRPSVAGVTAGAGDAGVFFASVLAAVRVRIAGRWCVALDAIAGTSLRAVTITSGSARAAGFTGPMLSVGLGVLAEL